jgi:hypothetical protein
MAFGPADRDTLRSPLFYAVDETRLKNVDHVTVGDHSYVSGNTIGRPTKNRGLQRFQARQRAHINAAQAFASCTHNI